MTLHDFIFTPGTWLGQGKICFSNSPDQLQYNTLWTIPTITQGLLHCSQKVEVNESPEVMINRFVFGNFSSQGFSVELSNHLITQAKGSGIVDEKSIAWEFKTDPEFQGFEVYEKCAEDEYTLKAEYLSSKEFRTIIEGRIWRRAT